MYNPEIMKRVSKHYKSGESLPEEMLQGLIHKQNANLAIGASSTSQVDVFDFIIHSGLDSSLAQGKAKNNKTMKFYRQNLKLKKPDVLDIPHLWDMTAKNFGEKLFNDPAGDGIEILIESVTKQDSLKYRYQWSQVYSNDIFQ